MLRDGITGDWIGTFEGHTGAVWSAKLNSNATRAATGSADSTAKLWDAVNGDCIHTFHHKKVVRTVEFNPDASVLATGGYESLMRLYDLHRPDADPTILQANERFTSRIRKLVWSPDGRVLWMGSEDGILRKWDLSSNKVVQELSGLTGAGQDPNKIGIMDMELSHQRHSSGSGGAGGLSSSSNNLVMTIAVGQCVTFVDPVTMEVTKTHFLNRDLETASLHPIHGRTFLAGGSDTWPHILDTETGAEILAQRGHHGKVHALRFAPNGTTYTSGADDATIRMWKYEDIAAASSSSSSSSSSYSSGGAAATSSGAGGASASAAAANTVRAGGATNNK
jgi:serine-threonine kinase receptor-associated protein